jgi:hypothetical protein
MLSSSVNTRLPLPLPLPPSKTPSVIMMMTCSLCTADRARHEHLVKQHAHAMVPHNKVTNAPITAMVSAPGSFITHVMMTRRLRAKTKVVNGT